MTWLPPWSLIESALRTLVLPAFAGSVLVFVVFCMLCKRTDARVLGGALALIAGLAAGSYFRELLEWWPVRESEGEPTGMMHRWVLADGWKAMLPITTVALLVGVAASYLSKRAGLPGVILRVLTAAGVAWWLGEALAPYSKAMSIAVLFAGVALGHEAMCFAASRGLRRMALLTLAVPWGGAAATVLIFAHSALFSDIATLMAVSACGAGLVAAIWDVEQAAFFAGPAAFIPPLMLAGAANTYSEVPAAAFACVAFAPCALWLLRIPAVSRLGPRAFTAVAFASVVIPCVIAVAMAAWMEDLNYGE